MTRGVTSASAAPWSTRGLAQPCVNTWEGSMVYLKSLGVGAYVQGEPAEGQIKLSPRNTNWLISMKNRLDRSQVLLLDNKGGLSYSYLIRGLSEIRGPTSEIKEQEQETEFSLSMNKSVILSVLPVFCINMPAYRGARWGY